MIRRLLRQRRTVPRRHAANALRDGQCMFAVHGNCDPRGVMPVGLRDPEDQDMVLCCARHYPDLKRLRPYEAERLARYLRNHVRPRHRSSVAR